MKKMLTLIILLFILLSSSKIEDVDVYQYKPIYPCIIMQSPVDDYILLEPGGKIIRRCRNGNRNPYTTETEKNKG